MSLISSMVQKRKLTWAFEVLILTLLAILPLEYGHNLYFMGLFTLLIIYTVLLIGLDITVGYLNQVNLSQAAFLAIGAYTGALLSLNFGLDLVSSLFFSFIVGFFFGVLLAIPALKLQGPHFALATLSFSTLVVTSLNEMEWLTQGAQGLPIGRPTLLGLVLGPTEFYWFCLFILVAVWLGMFNFLKGQWGRSFQAISDSPIAGDALGIGVMRHKIIAFAIGAGLGGMGGGLYAFNFLFLQPLSFGYELMVLMLLGVVLGGRRSLWGSLVGATIVTLLPNFLSNHTFYQSLVSVGFAIALAVSFVKIRQGKFMNFKTAIPIFILSCLFLTSFFIGNPEDWRKGIFAAILFSSVIGLPEGLMGFIEKQIHRLFKLSAHQHPKPLELDRVLPLCPEDPDHPILEIRDIKRYFGGLKAVDGISFNVKTGETLGIIGPNGSGKSTLINVISGFYKPSHGLIRFESKPLELGSLYKVSKHGIARTFQNLQLFKELTTLENVMVSLKNTYEKPWFMVMAGLAKNEEQQAESKALALLNFVGLDHQLNVRAKNLPYASQRFLEIARALAGNPRLLILDEPAAGMSKPDAEKLKEIITKIRERKIAVILIEHKMDFITELCDHVIVLESGKILAQGTAQEVKTNPKVITAYLGLGHEKEHGDQQLNRPKVSEENALVVSGLKAGYGMGEILHDLDIKVPNGALVVLIGANGVGKTTAMRAISGQLSPTKGNVSLQGKNVTGLPAYEIVRHGLSHSPEGRGVFNDLSVEDNLLLGNYIHLPIFFGFKKKAQKDLDMVYKLFPQLEKYKNRAAGTLSGGEQQMLAIGRALMSSPQIILLDEPSMGLAPVLVDDVYKAIEELNKNKISILLVEQFAPRALSIADYAYVLEGGHVAVEGPPSDLIKNPKVLAAYLGD